MRFLQYTLLSLLLFSTISALNIQSKPTWVNDYANILSASEEAEISSYLESVEQSNATQIVLLTVTSLEDLPIEDFSYEVAKQWKIGQKGFDNGVLLVVAPNQRKVRIEVGYGLEPMLTDAKCDYIIRNIMAPFFKRSDYALGIKQGLNSIGGIALKEFDISEADMAKFKKKAKSNKKGFPFGIVIFIIIILLSNLGRGRGSGGLFAGLLLGSMLGGGSRSGYSSGGGSFGGFSGGGGGFGGGGASGSW